MKKRTDEEKRQMIDEACQLLKEATAAIKQARKQLHLCGIEMCDGLNAEPVQEWNEYGSNLQVYSGIKKLEQITGVIGYHPADAITEKPDKSRRCVKYGGLVFLQVANAETSRYSYR